MRTESMSRPTETEPPRVRRLARSLKPRVGSHVGRFRLDEMLGRGSFGWVFKAFDEDLERHVALKILKQRSEEEDLELLEEARALAAVQHPSVVKVFEVSELEGHVVMAMELIGGGTLRQWAAERPRH
jgi:serine/threonine protein kinase